jgi:predicted nucleic acid-binding protein
MRICVDASIVLRLLVSRDPASPAANLWLEWTDQDVELLAPALLHYEVCNALRRYVVMKELLPEEGRQLLQAALDLGIHLKGGEALHLRALVLAEQFRLPAAYDAHYLAVAEHAAEFWTADRKLAHALGRNWPRLHLLP